MRRAGVVDHDIQPAIGADRRLDDRQYVRSTAYVPAHRHAADFTRDALGSGKIHVCHDDTRALLGEAPGDAFAEPARSASDNSDLSVETHGRCLLWRGR